MNPREPGAPKGQEETANTQRKYLPSKRSPPVSLKRFKYLLLRGALSAWREIVREKEEKERREPAKISGRVLLGAETKPELEPLDGARRIQLRRVDPHEPASQSLSTSRSASRQTTCSVFSNSNAVVPSVSSHLKTAKSYRSAYWKILR